MANIPTYDPLSSEIRSPLVAGEIEALNKISQILNMETEVIADVALEEVYIAEDDRYRIYQAPTSNRLWLKSPQPVIKINGTVKTPSSGYYEIDYVGGSIAFQDNHVLTASDTVTVSATIIKAGSTTINNILDSISSVNAKADKYKGYYETVAALNAAHPVGSEGDYAMLGGDIDSFYVWDETTQAWKPSTADVDLSGYYTKQEVDSSLATKEAKITPKGENTADDDYYYGGRKQWIDLLYKIKNFVLTGLSLDNVNDIVDTDTLIVALGKLQAQISGHRNNFSNPHKVTKSQIGLNLVDNTADTAKPVSTAQQAAIDGAKKLTSDHIADKANPHEVTAEQVGARPVSWTPSASDVGADPAGSASAVQTNLNTHAADTILHTSQAEKTAWNNKTDKPLILDGQETNSQGASKELFNRVTTAFDNGRQILYIPYDVSNVVCCISKKSESLITFTSVDRVGLIYFNIIGANGWFYSTCQTYKIALEPLEVTGTGEVTIVYNENTEYKYTDVTSLTISGKPTLLKATIGAHGIIKFATSATPTINVTGFAGSSGDDITAAAPGETWEFSVFADGLSEYGLIIWKNWGVI